MAKATVAANEVTESGLGCHPCGVSHAKPPIDVLGRLKAFIEGQSQIPKDRRRPYMGHEPVENRVPHITLKYPIGLIRPVEKATPTAHHRRTLESRETHGKAIRRKDVVVVHERDVPARGYLEARVPGRSRSPVRSPAYQAEATIVRKGDRIGAGVVDDYAFEVRDGLRQDGSDGAAEQPRTVPSRDDHRKERTWLYLAI